MTTEGRAAQALPFLYPKLQLHDFVSQIATAAERMRVLQLED